MNYPEYIHPNFETYEPIIFTANPVNYVAPNELILFSFLTLPRKFRVMTAGVRTLIFNVNNVFSLIGTPLINCPVDGNNLASGDLPMLLIIPPNTFCTMTFKSTVGLSNIKGRVTGWYYND